MRLAGPLTLVLSCGVQMTGSFFSPAVGPSPPVRAVVPKAKDLSRLFQNEYLNAEQQLHDRHQNCFFKRLLSHNVSVNQDRRRTAFLPPPPPGQGLALDCKSDSSVLSEIGSRSLL